MGLYKNVASQKLAVFAWDHIANAPKTGDAANISAQISLDGAATAATDDVAPAELDATDAKGVYIFDLTQAETNCDLMIVSAVSSTANVTLDPVMIYTTPGDGTALDANIKEVSDDSTAADNLELQYDTTGLTGDTFPATQTQVGAIAGISAAGFPTESEADNTGGAIKSITFVGVQTSGTYVSTEAEDGTYHQIDDDSNAIDIVYQFDVRGDRQGSEVIFKGYLSGANDEIVVQAYDYVGSDWETRATITGQAGSTNIDRIFTLLSKHTGISGSDRGKCLIRFVCSGQSNPTLYVDEVLVVATSLAQSVGYARGSVWIDTGASNTNTVDFVDGVADNPVSTIAAALTIAASVGLVHFEVATGSSITLAATVDGKTFNGQNWTLALGGQSCSDSVFIGATVSGTCTGAAKPRFERCIVNAVTLPPTIMLTCGLASTITAGSLGDFFLLDCVSLIAGTATPGFDYAAAVGSTNVSFRSYSGGIEIKNMGGTGTDTMSLEGEGQLIINASCTGGTVAIRGNFTVTDNAGGAVALSDDARIDVGQINDEVVDALNVDTYAEPGQGAPAATTSLIAKVGYLYKNWRNKKKQDATEWDLYNDDAATVDHKATVSDDGTDATKGEIATGP